jgi:hypothetical protein
VSLVLHFLKPRQESTLERYGPNEGLRRLIAIARFHGNSFTPFGATAGKYGLAALGFHTGTEAVRLGTVTAVRLKRALRH